LARPIPRSNLEKHESVRAAAQMNLVQTPTIATYANSVQIRASVWDFQLVFGLASPKAPDQITIRNHTRDLPHPASKPKGSWNMLGQHLAQYDRLRRGSNHWSRHGHNFPQGR